LHKLLDVTGSFPYITVVSYIEDRRAAEHRLGTDVLVIGGGPAATWAACSAAQEGARVVLVDKGSCGSSGVAASAGVGHWLVPPDAAKRDEAMRARAQLGGWLSDRPWQARVLDETWRRLQELANQGYPVAHDAQGAAVQRIGQAPQYMRFMRSRVRRLGVTILDHSPALELLLRPDGSVGGARGVRRQERQHWEVHAGAVVLATGGCTWKSKSLGGDVNTGDGQLMAAEVGAQLSGMEFSSFYGIVPRHTSMDKNGYYAFASFTREGGSPIDGDLFGSRAPLLQAACQGQTYAQLDRAPVGMRPVMRAAMPNFFMVLDKLRVDPFTQRFPIDFVLEGTVRGTGGLRIVGPDCRTGVVGLYAAGDVASREAVVGGATGAGAPNAAWAVSSGCWAGAAAARHARRQGVGAEILRPAGHVGLEASRGDAPAWRELVGGAQAELLPIEKNAFRNDAGLRRSLAALDSLWSDASAGARVDAADVLDVLKVREGAALLAMGRWAYASALARTESRAMHTRIDFPSTDEAQQQRILCGGLTRVWTVRDPVRPQVSDELLAS
jgi:succinate dehydrogenase/fumarate reductase flavoprotein subunit